MGFKELWRLVRDGYLPSEASDLLYTGPTDEAPYLLVDMSNILNTICVAHFGHMHLLHQYVENLWTAIFRSGYRIVLVKDGAHRGTRGVIKLSRMLSRESDYNFMTLRSDISTIISKVMTRARQDLGNRLVVELVQASEEADAYIRKKCEEITNVPVYVFSRDASLVLGLTGQKIIFDPLFCNLKCVENHAFPVLNAPVINIETVYTSVFDYIYAYVSRFNTANFGFSTSSIVEYMDAIRNTGTVPLLLVLAACLQKDEYSPMEVSSDIMDTEKLVYFMTNYLFDYNFELREKSKRTSCSLISSYFLWIIIFQANSCYLDMDTFDVVDAEQSMGFAIDAIVTAANGMIQNIPSLIGTCPKLNPGNFRSICTTVLNVDPVAMSNIFGARYHRALDLDRPVSVVYQSNWGHWMCFEPNIEGSVTEAMLHPISTLMSQIAMIKGCKISTEDQFSAFQANVVSQSSDDIDHFMTVFKNLKEGVVKESIEEDEDENTKFITLPQPNGTTIRYWRSRRVEGTLEGMQVYPLHALWSILQLDDTTNYLPDTGVLRKPDSSMGIQWFVCDSKFDVSDAAMHSEFGNNFGHSHGRPYLDLKARSQLLMEIVNPSKITTLLSTLRAIAGGHGCTMAAAIRKFWEAMLYSMCRTRPEAFLFLSESNEHSHITLGSLVAAIIIQQCRICRAACPDFPMEVVVEGLLVSPLVVMYSMRMISTMGNFANNCKEFSDSLGTFSDGVRAEFRYVEISHTLLMWLLKLTDNDHAKRCMSWWFTGFPILSSFSAPFSVDHPFYARLVHELGLMPSIVRAHFNSCMQTVTAHNMGY